MGLFRDSIRVETTDGAAVASFRVKQVRNEMGNLPDYAAGGETTTAPSLRRLRREVSRIELLVEQHPAMAGEPPEVRHEVAAQIHFALHGGTEMTSQQAGAYGLEAPAETAFTVTRG